MWSTPEPLPASDPLWNAPDLIVSPHFAGGGSTVSQLRLGAERGRQPHAAHRASR